MDENIEGYISVTEFLSNLSRSEITIALLMPDDRLAVIPRIYNRFFEINGYLFLVTAKTTKSQQIDSAIKVLMNSLYLKESSYLVKLNKENENLDAMEFLKTIYVDLNQINIYRIIKISAIEE